MQGLSQRMRSGSRQGGQALGVLLGCLLACGCVEHSTSLPDASVPFERDSGPQGDAGASWDARSADDATVGQPDGGQSDAGAPVVLPPYRSRTVIPAPEWSCGMPGGIPSLDRAQAVFDLESVVGDVYELGDTPFGRRRILALHGGTVRGVNLQGSLWIGGLDYELTRENGVKELEQVSVITPIDGGAIYVRSCGIIPSGEDEGRMVFDFEAPRDGPYAWLNEGTYFGARTVNVANHSVHLQVFQVSDGIEPGGTAGPAIRVALPAGVRAQPWDCPPAKVGAPALLYGADVGLTDPTLYVGPSKRGTRFVVPITGGSTSGSVAATILRGGGDFHLIDATGTHIDARSTMRTKDGTLIMVRTCGASGQLSTHFETPINGSAARLNDGDYRSDDPGWAFGGVHIVVRSVQ